MFYLNDPGSVTWAETYNSVTIDPNRDRLVCGNVSTDGRLICRETVTWTVVVNTTGSPLGSPMILDQDVCMVDATQVVVCVNGTLDRVGRAFEHVACGEFHTCAMTTQGVPICWGTNADGQLAPVPGTSRAPYLQLVTGRYFSCGIQRANAMAQCWGNAGVVTTLVAPMNQSRWLMVAAGAYHVCGIMSLAPVGGVQCWGINTDNQTIAPAIAPGKHLFVLFSKSLTSAI